MKRIRIIDSITHKPVESILFVLSVMLLIVGTYLFFPIDLTSYSTPLESAFPIRGQELAVAFLITSASAPGWLAPFVNGPWCYKLWRTSGFTILITFFFLSVLRILINGFFPLTWLLQLGIAVTAAICRLYLEAQKE